jgi:hypothetical protein
LFSFLKEVTGDISIGIKSIRDERELMESKIEYKELFKRISSCVAIYEATDNGNDFIFKDLNKATEKTEKIKRKDVIGKSVLKVFPGVKDFGLFDVFKRVYKTGKSENHSISFYKDSRISGWRENFVYKLPNGDIVAVYNDLTEKKKVEEDLIKAHERFVLAQKPEIAIYQGVYKQTISGHPLFIAPITCWLLCNQVPVRRALILHPCQGFFNCFMKKVRFTCYFSENANTQQKQRSCIT